MLQADDIITLGAGAYRLREALAGSAYGLVWRAQAPGNGPDVALKLINHEQMARARPEQRRRWVDSATTEIAFLQSLEAWDERHIVRLIDSGRHDGLPVMALELLGRDLGRHVAGERSAGRAVGLAQALAWLGQINQALAKVHQYGWRYLDLKPANVLLDGERVKLADFGTSRLLADVRVRTYTGTASWQAPEQFFPNAAGEYQTNHRTDYFALGAMLYYLVTGGLPLRFCSDCGQAYREHPGEGAAALLARSGGRVPPTLRDDEAALFTHRIERQFTGGQAAAGAALDLLRALLAADPGARPGHALHISRLLGAVQAAIPEDDDTALAGPLWRLASPAMVARSRA